MPTKFKYPLVEVIWNDAESDSSWSEVPTEKLKPTLALTIGFLVAEDEEHVLIADAYFLTSSKTIGNTTKIPRGMIKEMNRLNVSRKRNVKKVESGGSSPD